MNVSRDKCLLVIIAVCAATAAFGWVGCVAILIGMGGVMYVRAAPSTLRAVIELTGIALLVVWVLAVILPLVSCRSAWSCQTMCSHRLRSISAALLNYHRDYGSFPPACVRDKAGKPMHSWRVLVLPYMGTNEQELYSRYNLSEPWNSPENSKLAALRPHIYVCPNDAGVVSSADTSYVAVIGHQTVWPDSAPTRLDNIRDKPNETIQLVEVAESGIHWMEPRDLPFDVAVGGINRALGLSISSKHSVSTDVVFRETGACVAFCDSSSGFLSEGTSSDVLTALLTANGGETIPQSVFDAKRLDWPKCLAILVLVIAILLFWSTDS